MRPQAALSSSGGLLSMLALSLTQHGPAAVDDLQLAEAVEGRRVGGLKKFPHTGTKAFGIGVEYYGGVGPNRGRCIGAVGAAESSGTAGHLAGGLRRRGGAGRAGSSIERRQGQGGRPGTPNDGSVGKTGQQGGPEGG